MDTKQCPQCERVLPVEDFPVRKNGSSRYCLDCRRAQGRAATKAFREKRKDDPEYIAKRRAHGLAQHRKKRLEKHGLTPESYADLEARQGPGCAICGDEPTNGRAIHIDHDHKTGAVRGLLCYRCNTGLGVFLDDPVRLAAAIEYLHRSAGIAPAS